MGKNQIRASPISTGKKSPRRTKGIEGQEDATTTRQSAKVKTDEIKIKMGDRDFFTINDLIIRGHVAHTAIAHEINQSGVYRKPEHGKEPTYLDSQSSEAVNLLFKLPARRSIDVGEIEDNDYAAWFDHDDPSYSFGWPRSCCPKFVEHIEPPWFNYVSKLQDPMLVLGGPLLTVGRCLIFKLASVGEIVTIAEHDGIFGLDNYNRVMHYRDPGDLHDLMMSLSDCARATRGGKEIPESIFSEISLSRFGWTKKDWPDFRQRLIEIEMSKQAQSAEPSSESGKQQTWAASSSKRSDQDSGNGSTSQQNLIAALMSFIRGEITPQGHPEFRSQSQLTRLLTEKFPDVYGLSVDNFKKKFAAANKHGRLALGLPPVKDDD